MRLSPLTPIHNQDAQAFVRHFLGAVMGPEPVARSLTFPVHVRRLEDRVELHVEVPGIALDHIQLDVEDQELTVRVERVKPEDHDATQWRVERPWGVAERRFALSDTTQTDQISARLDQGVLIVTLPQQPAPVRKRRIAIDSTPPAAA